MHAYVNKNGIVTIGASVFMSPRIMNVIVVVATTAIAYKGTLFGPRYNGGKQLSNELKDKWFEEHTPLPKIPIPGMTFSNAILCKTLGVPYMAPKHDDILDT